ncbi:MAG: tetratricopeptide repeat protein, partial [Deltaproteobacteria bacterium]
MWGRRRITMGGHLLLLLAGVAWAAGSVRAEPTGETPSARGETIREHPQTPPSHPPTDDPLSPSRTETEAEGDTSPEQAGEAVGDEPLASILTFEDFIAVWRKRVEGGKGSQEVLALYDAAKKKPSVAAFEQCIELAKRVGDEWGEAVCSLDAYETLAQKMYASPESFEKAKAWTKRGGELGRRLLGQEAGPYALSLNNLALLFKVQGEYAAARPLYERALAIYEKALGPDHPNLALTLHNLAVLFEVQGEYAAARPLYERALAIYEKALGPDHPNLA